MSLQRSVVQKYLWVAFFLFPSLAGLLYLSDHSYVVIIGADIL